MVMVFLKGKTMNRRDFLKSLSMLPFAIPAVGKLLVLEQKRKSDLVTSSLHQELQYSGSLQADEMLNGLIIFTEATKLGYIQDCEISIQASQNGTDLV
jgi:hypothetical protein